MMAFVAIVPLGAAYNGYAAADYATKNAYSSYTFTNDCTNFASNALQAGGWQETGKYSSSSNDAWYFDFRPQPGFSNTWTIADSLYRFMSRHPERATAMSAKGPFYNYKVGDIIQIDYERDGRWDHTMVVTAISADYNNLQITQHGDNAPVKWLNSLKGTYSTANFIGWRIK
ncbi:MAG: amidase domain-containing protein [Candidatus Paceibacterota bacterium]|jgi:hypothetical protein